MNPIVGLVAVACLLLADWQSPSANTDLRVTSLLMALCFSSSVLLALAELLRAARQSQSDCAAAQCQLDRMHSRHLAVWALSWMTVALWLPWAHLVRGCWGLERWPLADELAILGPPIAALLVSWAILYDVERLRLGIGRDKSWWKVGERWAFVWTQARLYLLLLVPVLWVYLARDLALVWAEDPVWLLAMMVASALLIAGLYPLLLRRVWKTRELDPDLRSDIMAACAQCGLKRFSLRIWDTGGQIVNAAVVGCLSPVVWLSDVLVEQFRQLEIQSMVLHELGHVRRRHLLVRSTFLALPVVLLLVMFSASGAQVPGAVDLAPASVVLLVTAYVTYAVTMMGWMSRWMEFDADLFAIEHADRCEGENAGAEELCNALRRLARHYPQWTGRTSWLHPSIADRLVFARRAAADRVLILEFRRRNRARLIGVAVVQFFIIAGLTTIL